MADRTRPPHNPHDRFFRSAMENRDVARDFMRFYLPAHLSAALDMDSLKLQHDSYLDATLQACVSDLVFHCRLADKPAYLSLLVEHQSGPGAET
ncbi:MAG: hypothetical protein EA349_13615 [Halomonadaceae bacterium]|nr:MAG: hypothetical protein EA349_13615 [Halomonadaceae bacterium]